MADLVGKRIPGPCHYYESVSDMRSDGFPAAVAVHSDDPMRRDMYFRFNRSLQEFFNASAQIATEFESR